MSWHRSYRERVLAPDYDFASRHLRHHFLDALTAHVSVVARLPQNSDEETVERVRVLQSAILELHEVASPPHQQDVPDLYFAIQGELTERVGDAALLLRVGLSRNDLDMTVYKLRARELLLETGEALLALRRAVNAQAGAHLGTVLIAQTHHQPGQPTTVAHYLGAVGDMLARDSERLAQAYTRLNRSPLGAAALAGSSYDLDRDASAAALGFFAPVGNTYDAVASADWQFDVVAASQCLALDASRLVCDLLAWASYGWYRLGDGLVQGSSIMPQKRNPVALEHARTRFSRVLGAAGMVVYSSHNIPFADLNDFGPDVQGALQMQHLQLAGGLDLLTACLENGAFDVSRLAEAAAATDTTATELADVLVRDTGLSFPAAHAVVGALVVALQGQGRAFTTVTPADLAAAGGPHLPVAALREAVDPARFVERRRGLGMPAASVMAGRVAEQTERIAADAASLGGERDRLARARAVLRGRAA
ncbi:MAG TPA: lyase family protein [Trueperaceae bacterium]|nr:lyase family protein [Trueperaceae bacterium]